MTIAQHIRSKKFSGMLVVGDVHGDHDLFKMAVDYAEEHNLFFLSAGDLVDRGRKPFEVVQTMYALMLVHKGGFVRGNHDDKFYRYANGAKVSFSRDAKQTLADVGEERKSAFLTMYASIIDMSVLSGMFHKFDDITVAHAASHPSLWDSNVKFGSEAKARVLFGEVNGEKDEEGYPVRLYNWIEEIPMGKTIIVGHDRSPVFDVLIEAPLIRSNKNGGKAIFIDTSCGKGGFLTGVVVEDTRHGFAVKDFVEFKPAVVEETI